MQRSASCRSSSRARNHKSTCKGSRMIAREYLVESHPVNELGLPKWVRQAADMRVADSMGPGEQPQCPPGLLLGHQSDHYRPQHGSQLIGRGNRILIVPLCTTGQRSVSLNAAIQAVNSMCKYSRRPKTLRAGMIDRMSSANTVGWRRRRSG